MQLLDHVQDALPHRSTVEVTFVERVRLAGFIKTDGALTVARRGIIRAGEVPADDLAGERVDGPLARHRAVGSGRSGDRVCVSRDLVRRLGERDLLARNAAESVDLERHSSVP